MRLLILLLCAAVLVGPSWAQAGGEVASRRVALVIGNNAYETAPLANSVNDAQAMAGALHEAGFTVTLLTDIDQRQFQLALREFGERLRASGTSGVGLFYYAGHGVQIKGRNFLVPVRSHIAHEDEVAYGAIDAQAVLDKMESAGNGTNIVILDACRNNPFTRNLRSMQQGLAQMDAPVGTLVAYATAPGSVAIDSRPGMRNGLYTTHLLEALRQRGQKLEDVFKQVRNAVLRASANKQMPWEASALVGDFYFHPPREREGAASAQGLAATPPAVSPPTPAIDTQAAIDDALWQTVRESRSSAEVLAYLNRFPAGRHAREARARLLELAQPGGAAPAVAAPAGVTIGIPARATIPAAPAAPVRITAEQIVRWLPGRGAPRPASPRRTATGFSEGDRFEYEKTDKLGRGGVARYLWQVDSIADDGSLSVNAGRQRLDANGQLLRGNDEHTTLWTELSTPLPLHELARRGPGVTIPFKTSVRVRHPYSDLLEEVTLSGELRTSADTVPDFGGLGTPLPCVKIEVELAGTGRAPNSGRMPNNSFLQSVQIRWSHVYWLAPPLLLPVAFEVNEFEDQWPRQRTRHELIGIDQLSLTEAAGGGMLGR